MLLRRLAQQYRQTEQSGVGIVYCAVFGKPKLVSAIVKLLEL